MKLALIEDVVALYVVALDDPQRLLYTLPTGIKRIRHFGVLASACKGVKLRAARLALQMPAVNREAVECAQAFMARVARIDVLRCPCCNVGTLRVTAVLAGQGRLQATAGTLLPQSRGPPWCLV